MNQSLWMTIDKPLQWPHLREDVDVDVAVVGGGMAGVLIAYQLQQNGFSPVIFESKEVGSGVTMRTTAKITSSHNLIYDYLIKQYGEMAAKEYAIRNQDAVRQYEEISRKNNIDCEYKRETSYVYATNLTNAIRTEVEAAKSLGLPVSYTRNTALPFPVEGAIRYEEQASFNPIQFLYGIAKKLTGYEYTKVVELKKNSILTTEDTMDPSIHHKVRANYIVIATHYPIINFPGYYSIRIHQEQSYVAAVKTDKSISQGMYIGQHNTGFSFRRYNEYVLVGGKNHRVGMEQEKLHLRELKQEIMHLYHHAPIDYIWSTQDCMTIDSIPYIGHYWRESKEIYVATGFNKWGMSSSMVAANLITELLTKQIGEKDSIFSPKRTICKPSKKVLWKEIKVAGNGIAHRYTTLPKNEVEEIPRDSGMIVKLEGKRVGIYKDMNGIVYTVDARCKHLGCALTWNQEERTWDCPCHGSRYDYKGNILYNPTLHELVQPFSDSKK